jgi:hypothetical protein
MVTMLFILYNVFGLGEGGGFHHDVDAEHQTLINHKCVCGALNRHFCQLKISEAKPVLSAALFSVLYFVKCLFVVIKFCSQKSVPNAKMNAIISTKFTVVHIMVSA